MQINRSLSLSKYVLWLLLGHYHITLSSLKKSKKCGQNQNFLGSDEKIFGQNQNFSGSDKKKFGQNNKFLGQRQEIAWAKQIFCASKINTK